MSLALLLAALPLLYWDQPAEATAAALRRAGIERLLVPTERVDEWKRAGFAASALSPGERSAREALDPPGIAARTDWASATRRPWLDANGWRYLRRPDGSYFTKAPAGQALLAALEGFAYDADLVLAIDPFDLEAVGQALAFLRGLTERPAGEVADVGVVDDGSLAAGEAMKLLARRNLLFRPLKRPAPELPVNLELGSRDYPESDAADPDALALKVRDRLGDERRSLRLFGSEVVLARLTGDARRRRVQLLNYGGREIEGLRVRLRGAWTPGTAQVLGHGRLAVEALTHEEDATELSLPVLGPYAALDLTAAE